MGYYLKRFTEMFCSTTVTIKFSNQNKNFRSI